MLGGSSRDEEREGTWTPHASNCGTGRIEVGFFDLLISRYKR